MHFTIRPFLPLLFVSLGLFGAGFSEAAEPWPGAMRRLDRLPRDEAAIQAAHDAAWEFAATVVPGGEKLELAASEAKPHAQQPTDLPPIIARRGVLSMGSDITADDQKRLPFFTGGTILDQVTQYYLSVQALVAEQAQPAEKDKTTPYLLDRPLVAIATFRQSATTIPSTAIVDNSVRDIRSLGFWQNRAGGDSPPRTLVLAIKNSIHVPTSTDPDAVKPHYELIFLHSRLDGMTGELKLSAFGTTHHRTRLHQFSGSTMPSKLTECGIQASIWFTQYAYGGQYPLVKATRSIRLSRAREADESQLSEWAKSNGLDGSAWDHLSRALEAIQGGELGAVVEPAKP